MSNLNRLSNKELADLWNDLAKCFERISGAKNPGVGFFALSRETERRGLELVKHEIYGDIILKEKTIQTNCGSIKVNHGS